VIGVGGYGRFGALSREDLERYCYLDDEDRRLIAVRRRADTRLGFAVQVVTVRNLGMFLADPLDVPVELVEYLAEQLGIDDPSCVKRYTEREKTKLEHAWEIQREHGLVSFTELSALGATSRRPAAANSVSNSPRARKYSCSAAFS
jgi:hypothetical protein